MTICFFSGCARRRTTAPQPSRIRCPDHKPILLCAARQILKAAARLFQPCACLKHTAGSSQTVQMCPHSPSPCKRKASALTAKACFLCTPVPYSGLIASLGQSAAQAPHSMQADGSISYLPSPSEIAPTGQVSLQAPQETHASPITYAMGNTSKKKYFFRTRTARITPLHTTCDVTSLFYHSPAKMQVKIQVKFSGKSKKRGLRFYSSV